MKIEIVQTRGNYTEGTVFEVDDQIAFQLVAEGTARIVERVRTQDIVTDNPIPFEPEEPPQPEPMPVEPLEEMAAAKKKGRKK